MATAIATSLVSGTMIAAPRLDQFGGIVYDPSNYAQNVLTAARTLQQINNQIQQIQNQATSLINEARNLASLPVSTIQTLQQQVDQTRQLLNQAQRIAYDVTDVQEVFNGRYKGAALTGGQAQMVANANARWQDSVGAFEDAMKVQARSEEHTSELQSLMRISYAVFCLKKQKQQIKDRNAINNIKK